MLSFVPNGYKVVYHVKAPVGVMLEMIPVGETLACWTEMLTVQVFRNLDGHTLDSFQAGMSAAWAEMCPGGSTQILERGVEQTTPTLYWSQTCPPPSGAGSRENTWFKVLIRGETIVIVQKAFKFDPPEDMVASWLAFMRGVRVSVGSKTVH